MNPPEEQCFRCEVIDDQGEIEEWNDNKCIFISDKENFPLIVKDTNVQKHIISHFLNFYLSGKIPKGLNVCDLIFSVIAIMPKSFHSEEFIFGDDDYDETGTLFFLTPEARVKAEINNLLINRNKSSSREDQPHNIKLKKEEEMNIDQKNNVSTEGSKETELFKNNTNTHIQVGYKSDTDETDCNINDKDISTDEKVSKSEAKVNNILPNESSSHNDIVWYRKKPASPKSNTGINLEYGAKENAAFCISCNNLLSQWDSNMRARTGLKYFFGMTGLILMRGVVKSYQNLRDFFMKGFSNNLICSDIEYSIPHKGLIKKSCKAFRERDRKTQIMFAKLVICSLVCRKKLDSFGKQNILKFTVLSHTANYGMGLIGMLQVVASHCYNFHLVFKTLYSEETAESWEKVNRFFKKYMWKSANQHTYHWACIIDNNQFQYLSCYNNYALAVVTAVFIEKLTNKSDVWQAAWVNSGKDLEAYKDLGLKMYTNYKENSENCSFITGDEYKIFLNFIEMLK